MIMYLFAIGFVSGILAYILIIASIIDLWQTKRFERDMRQVLKDLEPIIKERLEKENALGKIQVAEYVWEKPKKKTKKVAKKK